MRWSGWASRWCSRDWRPWSASARAAHAGRWLPGQRVDVDVAAGQHDADAATGKAFTGFQDGRECGGAGDFHDLLELLPQQAHRGDGLLIRHREDIDAVSTQRGEVG